MASIKLTDVAVEFPVHNANSRSLQLHVLGGLGGKLAGHDRAVFVKALSGINLELRTGDRVGIIGHNGAGKTTLMRVLAGVYEPTRGSISVDGRLSSFTDITLGMDSEATGFDNIIFRCIFMGLSFKEARRLSPEIAEFSELGEFLRLPVRTYSRGMFLRLAFAISTSIEPDIMIMDEMIGAGDARFIEKAKARLNDLLQRVKILVLASHDAGIVKSLCNRIIWMDHGEIHRIGSFDEVYPDYLAATRPLDLPRKTGGPL